jgi:hypothetical protein
MILEHIGLRVPFVRKTSMQECEDMRWMKANMIAAKCGDKKMTNKFRNWPLQRKNGKLYERFPNRQESWQQTAGSEYRLY